MKKVFAYGAITLFGRLFQNRLTNQFFSFYTFLPHKCENDYFLQPPANPERLRAQDSRGLDSSLFARRYGGNIITILLVSPTIRNHQ
jgi:hypothetical protein